MNRKFIEKQKRLAKLEAEKPALIYNLIDSTVIFNGDYREIFDNAVEFAYGEQKYEYSEKSINAIMVNDVRHNYSNYEYNLKQLYKLNMTNRDYIQYKNSVLDKIANTYPSLENECDRQKRKLDMVKVCKR